MDQKTTEAGRDGARPDIENMSSQEKAEYESRMKKVGFFCDDQKSNAHAPPVEIYPDC